MRIDGERMMGLFLALVGAVTVAETFRLPEGALTAGPGGRVLPLVLGVIIMTLAMAVVLKPGGAREPAIADRAALGRVIATLVALVAYVLLFERVGFALSTVSVVGLLLVGYGERRWLVVVAVTLGVTAGVYMVFASWLGVPLPAGVLGR